MKKILIGLSLLTSVTSFANIYHDSCKVEMISESTGSISKSDLVNSLSDKGYIVSDEVKINSGNVPKNGLSVSINTGLVKTNKAVGKNPVTTIMAYAINSIQSDKYSGSIIINTSMHHENKYVPKFATIYSNNSFLGKTHAEKNYELVEEAYQILEAVPSCSKAK